MATSAVYPSPSSSSVKNRAKMFENLARNPPLTNKPTRSPLRPNSASNEAVAGGWAVQHPSFLVTNNSSRAGFPVEMTEKPTDLQQTLPTTIDSIDDNNEDDNIIPTPSSSLVSKQRKNGSLAKIDDGSSSQSDVDRPLSTIMKPVFLSTSSKSYNNGITSSVCDVVVQHGHSAFASTAAKKPQNEDTIYNESTDNKMKGPDLISADENRNTNNGSDGTNLMELRHQEKSRTERYLKAKQRSSSPALRRVGSRDNLRGNAVGVGGVPSSLQSAEAESERSEESDLTNNSHRSSIVAPPSSGSNGTVAGDSTSKIKQQKRDANSESRTVSKMTDHEARRALLNATKKRKESGSSKTLPTHISPATTQSSLTGDVVERVGEKANRAVIAMKNVSRKKPSNEYNTGRQYDTIQSTRSSDSGKTRRSDHPAVSGRTGRSKGTAPSKLSSADLLTSFRQFNATKVDPVKELQSFNRQSDVKSAIERSNPAMLFPNSNNLRSSSHFADGDTANIPRSVDDEIQSFDSAEGLIHHKSFEQEDSMHSMNDTQYQHKFHHVEKFAVATKQSFNDTYLSSLSSNTFSIQSLKSPAGKITVASPMSFKQEEFVLSSKLNSMLETTQENSTSTQTMKSGLAPVLSPGPSHRSNHSAANSINSASPTSQKACYRSGNDISPEVVDSPAMGEHIITAVCQEGFKIDATALNHREKVSGIDFPPENSPPIPSKSVSGENVSQKDNSDSQVEQATKENSQMASAPCSSGRSNSPPGFVFGSNDGKKHVDSPPDPDVKPVPDDGPTRRDEDRSTRTSTTKFQPTSAQSFEGVSAHQHGSSSTKQTVSTSIRTGYSGIQNEQLEVDENAPEISEKALEGSTSIRTDLSGLQSPRRMSAELEHSISLRASTREHIRPTTGSMDLALGEIAETIFEERSKLTGPEVAEENPGKDGSVFSGLKECTAGEVPSAAIRKTGLKTSGIENGFMTRDERAEGGSLSDVASGVQTNNEVEENKHFSLVSTDSRPWKSKVGKQVNQEVKNTLAKATPRATEFLTVPKDGSTRQDSASLFSSVEDIDDDDDDIFGGLEGEGDIASKQKEATKKFSTHKSFECQKSNVKTPKQRNSKLVGKNTADSVVKQSTNTKRNTSKKENLNRKNGNTGLASSKKKGEKKMSAVIDVVKKKDREPQVDLEPQNFRSKSSGKSKPTKSISSPKIGETPLTISETTGMRETMGFATTKVDTEIRSGASDDKEKESLLASISCGLAEHCGEGFARICIPGKKAGEIPIGHDDDAEKSFMSNPSSTDLTDLEKKVWNEWDRLNENVDAQNATNEAQPNVKKLDHEKKREAARDKLLDIASTAMNSHVSGNLKEEEGKDQKIVSASVSSNSVVIEDSTSSGATSCTVSGESRSASSQEESSRGYISESSSDIESYFVSKEPFVQTPTVIGRASRDVAKEQPMLLSLSQRYLMEKLTKQLTSVGVEVLKLNTRKQWQVRYFTVSKERIALSAHEAINKSGDMAYCPKALLWLKKFNPKHGGYDISTIDKNGHGGMLLVDLCAIQVSNITESLLENPLPKKLKERFKESTLVTLEYKINGCPRSIELRCKNNDETQFLCTCLRVIRDLLRRERSLRQKSKKQRDERS